MSDTPICISSFSELSCSDEDVEGLSTPMCICNTNSRAQSILSKKFVHMP